MIRDQVYTLADAEFYAPLSEAPAGREYAPTTPPAGWSRTQSDVWTMWSPAQADLPEQGWKVHVSAPAAQAQQVLDVVALACGELGVPFKHLRGSTFFLAMHAKHAHRAQAGKFCALYPRDPEQAGRVLERLAADLAGVEGPYVLTDRRFGESRCVAYRYGSFTLRSQLQADGSRRPTMLVDDGTEVADERTAQFRLPSGLVDPWAPQDPIEQSDDDDVTFHGYTFEKVLQHSNAGGAYRARTADGRQVFIKEARAHNGYTSMHEDAQQRLQREYLTLQALHRLAPGLAPEPIGFFSHWEHTYMVTEHVPGKGLHEWLASTSPLVHVDPSREEVERYFQRCDHILRQLEEAIDRLHGLGYLFGDLSVRNVLVDGDTARLIDFECTQSLHLPPVPMGTPGFTPPELMDDEARARMDPRRVDRYALGGVARALLVPQLDLGGRNPAALPHARDRLRRYGTLPEHVWQLATGEVDQGPAAAPVDFPTPAQVEADVVASLRDLRESTADAIEALVRPGHRDSVYPTCPEGLGTNTRCVAYGTAGVLHALRAAGRDVDRAVVATLRDDSLRLHADTPPGLLLGSAGIAWVLADLGETDAARELLDRAADHPLVTSSATWGGGAAGLAMADLAMYERTDDPAHLERAARVLGRLPDGDGLTPLLGPDDASGLLYGRPGVALALGYLARRTADDDPMARGLQLLRDELRHGLDLPTAALGFRVSARDSRNMPYLYAGSAGFVHVLGRYAAWAAERGEQLPTDLASALEMALRTTTLRLTVSSGLFVGQAGLSLVQGDLGRLLGRGDLVEGQLDSARTLFQHAVPHSTGTRWLGGLGGRVSCDLWSGAAGVLLALTHAVRPFDDPLFSLDAATAPRGTRSQRTHLVSA